MHIKTFIQRATIIMLCLLASCSDVEKESKRSKVGGNNADLNAENSVQINLSTVQPMNGPRFNQIQVKEISVSCDGEATKLITSSNFRLTKGKYCKLQFTKLDADGKLFEFDGANSTDDFSVFKASDNDTIFGRYINNLAQPIVSAETVSMLMFYALNGGEILAERIGVSVSFMIDEQLPPSVMLTSLDVDANSLLTFEASCGTGKITNSICAELSNEQKNLADLEVVILPKDAPSDFIKLSEAFNNSRKLGGLNLKLIDNDMKFSFSFVGTADGILAFRWPNTKSLSYFTWEIKDGIYAGGSDPSCSTDGLLNFEEDIMPLTVQYGCATAGCHSDSSKANGLSFESPGINPGRVDHWLNALAAIDSGIMPPFGPKVSLEYRTTISQWIDEGAKTKQEVLAAVCETPSTGTPPTGTPPTGTDPTGLQATTVRGNLIASTGAGLVVTSLDGKDWKKYSPLADHSLVIQGNCLAGESNILVGKKVNGKAFTAVQNAVDSWVVTEFPLVDDLYDCVIDKADAGRMFFGGSQGLYLTYNATKAMNKINSFPVYTFSWAGNVLIAAGEDIYYSQDISKVHWGMALNGAHEDFKSSAIGNGSMVFRSGIGVRTGASFNQWSGIMAPIMGTGHVNFINGEFIFYDTESPRMHYSVNGSTWSSRPSNQGIQSFSYAYGHYAGIAKGKAYYSVDGQTWMPSPATSLNGVIKIIKFPN